jgi:hypothetical protein
MKVLKTHWVTLGGGEVKQIGIIETINKSGQKRVRAGFGRGLENSEKEDIQLIKTWGGKIIPSVIADMYKHIFGGSAGLWHRKGAVEVPKNTRVLFVDYNDEHQVVKKMWLVTIDPSGIVVDPNGFKTLLEQVEYTHFMMLARVETEK